MVFKTTSTTTSRARRRIAGLTLIEVLVGSTLGLLVLSAVMATSMFAGRSLVALRNYTDLDAKSRDSLDRLSRDIRQMEYLTNYTTVPASTVNAAYLPSGWTVVTNRLVFAPSAGAPSNTWLTFYFNPTNKTLTRISNSPAGTVSSTMLTGCEFLNFGLWQRNMVSNAFKAVFTTQTNEVKLIAVDWVCTRTMIGAGLVVRTNSESIQSASFVIRRQ